MTDIHEALKPLAVEIDSLTPDPSNARKHDKRNIEAIKASLARVGQTKPIVLHSNGTTILDINLVRVGVGDYVQILSTHYRF